MAFEFDVTILGCGTSGGVPRAPLYWGACDPTDLRNRRTRASILLKSAATNLIVDTSPDFREQALRTDIKRIDGVLYTHDHADHLHGIDDLRGFYQTARTRIPVYANKETLAVIQRRFDYIFENQSGYPALCTARVIDGPFTVGDFDIVPFEQGHGAGVSLGFRCGTMAYSTDLNRLDEAAFEALEGVDIWIVDALRYEPHATHAHLEQTLGWIARVKPKRAILTHLAWEMDFKELSKKLPKGVEVAYDGLSFTAFAP